MPLKKLTLLSLFTTISLAVYAIESAVPPLVPIPGIKLGLANIVTLVLLRRFRAADALMVLFCRILLSALLFGQALSLLYSLAGGLTSLLVMCIVTRLLRNKRVYLTGAMGGLTHNMGQLLVAIRVVETYGVLYYMPTLIIAGLVTGLVMGISAALVLPYLQNILAKGNFK